MKRRDRKELAVPSMYEGLQAEALRMRASPTRAEDALWQALRAGRLDGLRFRRQHPVGRSIADCYCVQARLIVEVDGPVHDKQVESDAERDDYLTAMGLTVLRVSNEEVLTDINKALARVRQAATESHT